jgi:hypothetical protein
VFFNSDSANDKKNGNISKTLEPIKEKSADGKVFAILGGCFTQ